MDSFRAFFPNDRKVYEETEHFAKIHFHARVFYPSNAWEKETTPTFFPFDGYDDPHNAMSSEAGDTFCDASGLNLWEDTVNKTGYLHLLQNQNCYASGFERNELGDERQQFLMSGDGGTRCKQL